MTPSALPWLGWGRNVLIGAFGEDPGGIVDAGAAIYLMGTPERCA
jgi:hypothetical protein